MSDLALKLDHVSKMYRLGQVGTGTLAHDLNRAWARLTGREDPFSRVGSANDREEAGGDYVWALRDINFEVAQGDVVGIIGRNGAGKSTLLKLLSRVTAPSEGNILINGRVASLLEVGTGFHPDLSGRDNIYLNGAILGMSRQEIRARFDEIVEFSGCAKYIDTPVKRYSSGMYVRLAFAVAAHLETDILIVDEVLAVGDAEFQQKCLGKMREMSQKSHRTVLFVSHNMAAVKRLCPRSVLMERGTVTFDGPTDAVVERYMARGGEAQRVLNWPAGEAPANDELRLETIAIVDSRGRTDGALSTEDPIELVIGYTLLRELRNLRIGATLTNSDGIDILSTSDFKYQPETKKRPAGQYRSRCRIPAGLLNTGVYSVQVDFEIPFERKVLESLTLAFDISELSRNELGPTRALRPRGVVHPILPWTVEHLENVVAPARLNAASE